jgi:ATP-dependent Clp protease ATP-binding subunit ClpC
VLFDEIEKAHPDVFNMLLQILEDGRLTDSKGRTVSFKNTLIVMTSNVGAKAIERGGGGALGFEVSEGSAEEVNYQRIKGLVENALKESFRPEFLNRLDDIIVFRQLSKDEVSQIAEILLEEIAARAYEEYHITLKVSDVLKAHIITTGFNPSYGARELRRSIIRNLETNLAEALLSGQVHEGDTAFCDLQDDGVRVSRSEGS